MKTFYQITQYSLTQKGSVYRSNNPETPWGCVELTKEDIDNIYKKSYESLHAMSVDYLETGCHTNFRGKRRTGNFIGMGQILNKETGEIKSYESWLEGKPTPKYFENPNFYYGNTRGYVETIEDFENHPCMYSLSEGYYYTRFRLSERRFGLDTFSFEDDNLYEVSHDSDIPIKCDEWEGFSSCGDLIGCGKMCILEYIEKNKF